MGDLTKNISRHEIACNCGCGLDSIDYITVLMVQDASDYFSSLLGRKCILDIHSGCRCLAWNDHEDGSENSQHLYSRAIDHSIRDVSVDDLYNFYIFKYLGNHKYGIGRYSWGIHIDTRSGKSARWQ
jgi:zinc D-Ala-D-Ala carboxypeptidase